jgi:hypothetical protein
MNSLYWLRDPAQPAASPRRWSYSALALWRRCPRRWWLQNARYENAPGGTYPLVFGPAALQGRLVHAALEAERKAGRAGSAAQFRARRFLMQALRDLLDGEVAKNPRLNVDRLEAGVSLDECLAKYFVLRPPQVASGAAPLSPAGEQSHGGDGPPANAQEYWVEVEDPPLAGRIDQVRGGGLVDFKTGDEDLEAHGDQLLVYSVLWWLRFGERPASLEVRYPGRNQAHPLPTEEALEKAAAELRKEVQGIIAALSNPPPQARPDVEHCKNCPIRQLCPDFWHSPETLSLRTPPTDAGNSSGPPIRDIELTRPPEHWQPGKPMNGVAVAAEIGPVQVNLPRNLCPEDGAKVPVGGRLLQVLVLSRPDASEIRQTAVSEAFWKEQE